MSHKIYLRSSRQPPSVLPPEALVLQEPEDPASSFDPSETTQ